MRHRYVPAVLAAFIMVVLDLVAYPLILGSASPIVQPVFFGPFLLGARFLVFAREAWGWPIAAGYMTSLSDGWTSLLFLFNLLCYAALGFFVGSKLGGRFWKER